MNELCQRISHQVIGVYRFLYARLATFLEKHQVIRPLIRRPAIVPQEMVTLTQPLQELIIKRAHSQSEKVLSNVTHVYRRAESLHAVDQDYVPNLGNSIKAISRQGSVISIFDESSKFYSIIEKQDSFYSV